MQEIFNERIGLALIGCLVGWITTLPTSKDPWTVRIADLSLGLIVSYTLTAEFITESTATRALLLGAISGYLGAYAFEIVRDLLPEILKAFIETLINKYRK